MSEPVNPIAAGVASAFKSLRSRVGLQEDRLDDSEPAVGMLAGLDSVRELVANGNSVPHAIVQAVRTAASMLNPTHSIVADVSLSLGLSAHDLPGSELYARDLGRRREVLLENWDRLHELRSAPPPGTVPTLRTLRLEIETDAFTALAVALTDPGRQWVSLAPSAAGHGTLRPGGHDTGSAAGMPGARPDTQSGTGLIAGQPPEPDHVGSTSALSRLRRSHFPRLLDVFQRIAQALRDALLQDDEGLGWPHDLRKGSRPHTPMSTAYAIKVLLQLEGFLASDLLPVVRSLRERTKHDGGYSARSQKGPRPEGTAAVLDALHRIDGTASFDTEFAAMKDGLGDFEKTRPFILTTVLETSVQLGSDLDLTRSLVKDLLATRRQFGDGRLWPEKAEKDLNVPAPSVVHTARAVRALVQALTAWPPDREHEPLAAEAWAAADEAAAWLAAEPRDLTNVSENIDRQLEQGKGVEPVYVRHFTAAWVVKALVSAGLPTSYPTVSNAVAQIWADYDPERGLWIWSNGDLPVWMTMDAVDALRMAAMATPVRSGAP